MVALLVKFGKLEAKSIDLGWGGYEYGLRWGGQETYSHNRTPDMLRNWRDQLSLKSANEIKNKKIGSKTV